MGTRLMSQHQAALDVGTAAMKAAPVLAVAAADSVLGIPLQSWVYILTIIYLLFQLVVIAPKVPAAMIEFYQKVIGWFRREID